MRAALANEHSRTRRRVFSLAFATFLVGALALAGVASADLWTPESGGGSPNADNIDTLYKIILGVAAVVFVGVEGVLVYSLLKFRARKDAVPAQIRGNTRLEIGWTLGATVVLVVLAVVTFAMLPSIRTPPNSDADGFPTDVIADVKTASAFQPRPPNGRALKILVNGQRYVWRYTYPGDKPDTPANKLVAAYVELVVPTKTTITLDIEAQDVAHSWWIPELGGKADAVPGHTNFTWFKIEKPGIYRGQCAELCGRNHADMVAQVRAIPPDEFKTWLEDKRREIDENNAGALKRREEDAKKNESANDAPNAQAEGASGGDASEGEAEETPAAETETTP
jgi:cytochrome c oxidase subunit 2